jgi:hypothetical protein
MRKLLRFCLLSLLLLMLTACASDDAGTAVESYMQARIDGDADRVRSLVCAAQEAQAVNQAASLAGVDASLEGMECTVSGTEGEFTIVTCQGNFVFNYDGEIQERPIGNWLVAQEGGAWRVCGEAGR